MMVFDQVRDLANVLNEIIVESAFTAERINSQLDLKNHCCPPCLRGGACWQWPLAVPLRVRAGSCRKNGGMPHFTADSSTT